MCVEDNKCLTTTLSTDDKEHVSKEDLLPGNELVWSHKGKKDTNGGTCIYWELFLPVADNALSSN